MSISMPTSTVTVFPMSNASSNGRVYRTALINEPVSYNMQFMPDGGKNPKQLEALYDKCAEEGIKVQLITAQGIKVDNYKNGSSSSFIVYDVIPQTPSAPQMNK